MKPSITLIESIRISAEAEKIFGFISDLRNDPTWRPEVESMTVAGETKVGSIATELITVYKFFHFVTPVKVLVLDSPRMFVAETPETHSTWVKVIRSLKPLENGEIEFTVNLSFSLDNMKQITPIIPPKGIIRAWYKPRMKRYLRTLKRLMENNTVS